MKYLRIAAICLLGVTGCDKYVDFNTIRPEIAKARVSVNGFNFDSYDPTEKVLHKDEGVYLTDLGARNIELAIKAIDYATIVSENRRVRGIENSHLEAVLEEIDSRSNGIITPEELDAALKSKI